MLTANEGSIPACAGEPMSDYEVRRLTVYPRVCGGTGRQVQIRLVTFIGSIPACAGEPMAAASVTIKTGGSGLSPRVRGNRT